MTDVSLYLDSPREASFELSPYGQGMPCWSVEIDLVVEETCWHQLITFFVSLHGLTDPDSVYLIREGESIWCEVVWVGKNFARITTKVDLFAFGTNKLEVRYR